MPPIEAAIAGNKVIGYTGEGGKDFFKKPIFYEIESGNIKHFCEEILKVINDETVVVPGHGPISTTQDIQNYIDKLVVVKDRIAVQIAEGKNLQEIQDSDPAKEWREEFGEGPFIAGLVDRAYAGMIK